MTDLVNGIISKLNDLYMERLLRSERPGLPQRIADSRARDAHGVKLAIDVVKEFGNA